jgi:hypothetical protein
MKTNRGTGNAKRQSGPSTSRADRTRRKIELSLSSEAHVRLGQIAWSRYDGNKSATVEALLMAASLLVALFIVGCGGADGGPLTAPDDGRNPGSVLGSSTDTVNADGGAKPTETAIDTAPAADQDAGTRDAGNSPSPSPDAGPSCVPAVCGAIPGGGAYSVSDGCGGTLHCPARLPPGPNCTPTPCSILPVGYSGDDGCGNTVTCPGATPDPSPDAGTTAATPDAGGTTSSCFVDNPSQCCSSTVAACCQTAHGPVESCVPAYGLQPLGLLGSQVSCSQEVDGCQRTGTCCQ